MKFGVLSEVDLDYSYWGDAVAKIRVLYRGSPRCHFSASLRYFAVLF